MSSRLTQSLCGREVQTGSTFHPDRARVGYISLKPPLSLVYDQNPQTHRTGFNARGKIIGYNAHMPYPGQTQKYHDIPFLRHVDWAGGAHTNTTDTTPNSLRRERKRKNPELDEYFTAENDEGYRAWAARQAEESCNTEAEREGRHPPTDHSLDAVKPEASTSVSHCMPVIVETTNQTYGSYTDLEANYYAQVKVVETKAGTLTPVRSNQVGRKRKEDADIPTVMGYMDAKKSSRTTYMTSYNQPEQMTLAGLRSKCHTFQVNSPTGLEMNRIPITNRSLFATMAQQELRARPNRINMGNPAPPIVLRMMVPNCPGKGRDMFKMKTGYMCLEKKDSIC